MSTPKKQSATATIETKAVSRMIAPMQSIGRCGKSTFMQVIHHFLAEHEVESSIVDLDEEHQTMRSWYPEIALVPFRNAEDLGMLFNYCGANPVELLDFPAQATEQILKGFETFKADAIFEEKGIRLLIPIFASNEHVAMSSAAQIIAATRHYADYIVVRNPAKYQSHLFEASKLSEMLQGAPTIELPALSEMTVTEVQNASRKAKKLLTYVEATEHVPIAARMEIKHWLRRCKEQLEQHKALFVPDVALLKGEILPESAAPGKKAAPNFFDL